MAEASKSAKDPVLEQKFLTFLRERIGLHELLSIKNLTGHLSALSPRVRNHFGASRSCLKQFLTEHPKDFYVDKKDNVRLATKDSSSSSNSSSTEHTPEKPSENHTLVNVEKPAPPPKEQISDFPKELLEVRGKVYRLFPAYGFISVSSPVVCSVYFNVNCFENSRGNKTKDGVLDIAIGEGVYLNAKKGPDNVEAQYRATKVWRVDSPARKPTFSESSTTRSGLSSPVASSSSKGSFSNTSAKKEIYGTGRIDNMFMKFGFISQNNTMKDNIFFHVKTFHKPGMKKITNLMDFLKLGDSVNFSAIPTEQKNTLVRWQATRVWLPNDEGMDGSEIYYSSPEASMSSGSVESLPMASACVQMASSSQHADKQNKKLATNHVNCVGNHTNNNMVESNHSSINEMSNNSAPKTPLSCQIGTIWPHSEQMASIVFGKDQKALVLIDVFYQREEHIDNFMWEVEDGQRIQFEAIEDSSWAPEYPWKATLAWVGRRPDVPMPSMSQLRDAYLLVCGDPIESNEDWAEPENVANEEEEDEDFIEENMEDDGVNDNDHFADNEFGGNPPHSDTSLTEGNDFEDDGFEDNIDNLPSDTVSSVPLDKIVDSRAQDEKTHASSHASSLMTSKMTTAHLLPMEKFTAVGESSMSWADITENEDKMTQAKNASAFSRTTDYSLKQQSDTSFSPSSSTDVLHTVEPQASQDSGASVSSLEKKVDELTLLVQELLTRVPSPKSVNEVSTQTGPYTEQLFSSMHRHSTANREAQTVSTGQLMYTQLYYNQ